MDANSAMVPTRNADKFDGYLATRSVTVRLSDMGKIGAVLAAGIAAGGEITRTAVLVSMRMSWSCRRSRRQLHLLSPRLSIHCGRRHGSGRCVEHSGKQRLRSRYDGDTPSPMERPTSWFSRSRRPSRARADHHPQQNLLPERLDQVGNRGQGEIALLPQHVHDDPAAMRAGAAGTFRRFLKLPHFPCLVQRHAHYAEPGWPVPRFEPNSSACGPDFLFRRGSVENLPLQD